MRIKTSRLFLCDFIPDDWTGVLWPIGGARSTSATTIGATAPRPTHWRSRKCSWTQQAERPAGRFHLAVTLPSTGRLIDDCSIRRKPDNDYEAAIGYELAPGVWGNGFPTETARGMVDFGFQRLKLHRTSSWYITDNTTSARVLEEAWSGSRGQANGECILQEGRWWDTRLY